VIKYLIIDDEHIAHDIIKGYCDQLQGLELQQHCYDALEAIQYLNAHKVDLIFLDLNMPRLKGFEFLRTLLEPPKVIVTTAYSEFALEGYELNVVDYLLKPFSFERFLKAVNKAIGSPGAAGKSMPVSERKGEAVNRIFLRGDKKYHQVAIDEIRYIEAAGNYTKVVTGNEIITTREKLSVVLESLSGYDLLQVHKSFAIAPRYIKSIEGNEITIGSSKIPVGKMYKLNVDRLLG
jgi:DNA-binding LytR/AlgR family response regulator